MVGFYCIYHIVLVLFFFRRFFFSLKRKSGKIIASVFDPAGRRG